MFPTREVSAPPIATTTPSPANPVYNLDAPIIAPFQGKDPQDIFVPSNNPTKDTFTRTSDPQNPARLKMLLNQIGIRSDLTPTEKSTVTQLIIEFADCFALSMGEVIPVTGAVHHLNIPENAVFSRKVRQRPLTPAQRPWFHKKLDEMLAAGIIAQCHPSEVKAVSPTTLAQKAHKSNGLTLDKIRQLVNDQLLAAGSPKAFIVPPRTSQPAKDGNTEQKWRVCQDFAKVNKVTQVTPMP